mmetsp:Transcript_13998/g.31294  ORF Transcript_13998/g.31294 Transcript_13998/m.31294 type:complete len:502 (-) Transcript_13998:881-2386(-)
MPVALANSARASASDAATSWISTSFSRRRSPRLSNVLPSTAARATSAADATFRMAVAVSSSAPARYALRGASREAMKVSSCERRSSEAVQRAGRAANSLAKEPRSEPFSASLAAVMCASKAGARSRACKRCSGGTNPAMVASISMAKAKRVSAAPPSPAAAALSMAPAKRSSNLSSKEANWVRRGASSGNLASPGITARSDLATSGKSPFSIVSNCSNKALSLSSWRRSISLSVPASPRMEHSARTSSNAAANCRIISSFLISPANVQSWKAFIIRSSVTPNAEETRLRSSTSETSLLLGNAATTDLSLSRRRLWLKPFVLANSASTTLRWAAEAMTATLSLSLPMTSGGTSLLRRLSYSSANLRRPSILAAGHAEAARFVQASRAIQAVPKRSGRSVKPFSESPSTTRGHTAVNASNACTIAARLPSLVFSTSFSRKASCPWTTALISPTTSVSTSVPPDSGGKSSKLARNLSNFSANSLIFSIFAASPSLVAFMKPWVA